MCRRSPKRAIISEMILAHTLSKPAIVLDAHSARWKTGVEQQSTGNVKSIGDGKTRVRQVAVMNIVRLELWCRQAIPKSMLLRASSRLCCPACNGGTRRARTRKEGNDSEPPEGQQSGN